MWRLQESEGFLVLMSFPHGARMKEVNQQQAVKNDNTKKHVFYGVLQGLQGCFLWGLRGSSSIFWGGDVFIHITWKRGESDSWFGLPRLPTFGVWMVSSYSTTSHHYNLHPWKLTCPLWNLTLKGTIWIGNTSSNHPFSGAMLVAGRVCFQTFDCFPYFLRMWKIAIGR